MTVHDLHQINLPCDGKRWQGLAGERFKSWSEITFSLFFFPPPTEAHEVFTSRFYPPAPLPTPLPLPHHSPFSCEAISGGEPITSSQLSLALFCRAQRVLHTATGARNTGAAHVGNPETFVLFAARCSLDILVETQIKNVKIMARLCFREH